MKLLKLLFAGVIAMLTCLSHAEAATSLKDQPGAAYLGDDVLWRPREWVVFNMLNETGAEFNLKFTVRDMNTYVHAPAPAYFFVVSPDSQIVARQFLEDDGITGGKFKHQDGIYDPYADFKYRQYHRVHSFGSMPAAKERSPFLDKPELLPARTVNLKVPAAGKGLYRVVVAGRWDHWISVTPDRAMPTGVNPGMGPLYVHGATLKESYFYVPKQSEDIGLMLTEEVFPYNSGMTLKDSSDKVVKSVKAQGFATYIMVTPENKDSVYKLELDVKNTGVCLHGKGFPYMFCPDPETAKKLHGGMEVDKKGRVTYHKCTTEIDKWVDSLTQKDLEINVKLTPEQEKVELTGRAGAGHVKFTLAKVAKFIESQDIDPKSKDFGKITAKIRGYNAIKVLSLAAGIKMADNPYYGNPALIRRVLLTNYPKVRTLTPEMRFEAPPLPWKKKETVTKYFDLPGRSNWYNLGLDARNAVSLQLIIDVAANGLPENVIKAWQDSLRLCAAARANMHVGEVANQWGYNYLMMEAMYKATGDKVIEDLIYRHIKLVTTPGLYGRLNPDINSFDRKKGKLDTDCGLTPSGYMPEQMGFDGEYTCEQTLLWGKIWQHTKSPEIVKWFNKFNYLKTHLTMSKTADTPPNTFSGTCSPTDLNFRTRYMTHKNHQPKDMVGMVKYLDLWFPEEGKEPKKTWPFLEEGSFTRIIDDKFFFIKKPKYYTILYGGPRLPAYANWGEATIIGDSMNFDGYGGSGYGGWGTHATKAGGISALYVTGCGPILLGQNHTIMDTNTVWGKSFKPLFESWRKGDVDPTEFAACYSQPEVKFSKWRNKYTITEKIRFMPINVKRVFKFKDDCIKVSMRVEALDDFKCKELNYSIPFFADKRIITAITDGNSTVIDIPKPVTTPSRPRFPDAKLEKSRWNLEPFKASKIDVTAENGKGIEYIFEEELSFKPLLPFRYRAVAPAGGSFIISLPNEMKIDDVYKLDYTINLK